MSVAYEAGSSVSDPRSPAPAPGTRRPAVLGALTSLRYLIALHVALYHFVRPFERWGALSAFFAAGYSGVSFFFVLSGFILTYAHAAEYEVGRGSLRRFWLARFARIYPVYALSVLLAAYVDRRLFVWPTERLALAANFVMVQAWSTRLIRNFNVPSWSLSCEAFFYLVFPFMLLKLRPASRVASVFTTLGLFIVAMLAPAWALLHYHLPAMHELPLTNVGYGEVLRIRRLPLLALPEFLVGISLGWFYLRGGVSARSAQVLTWAGGLLLCLALCFSGRLPYVFLHNGLLMPLQCAVILGLTGRHRVARWLSQPWLMVLGEASFSFYLIHLLLFELALEKFGVHTGIARAVLLILSISGISVLLYRYIERPSRRWLLLRFGAGARSA